MKIKLGLAAVLLASTFAVLPGCAVDAPQDQADVEEASTSEAELSANASRFVGAYHGAGSVRPPSFQGLVFDVNGTFFGDVDTGIRCVTAPCPSSVHLEGRYSSTKNYLRLSPKSGPAGGYYVNYRVAINGSKVSLSHPSFGAGWSNTLTKKISYCAQPSDCGSQGLIVPSCMGSFTCGSGIGSQSANSCGWKCGVFPPPPAAIWPATASKLVAENSGGGFRPPPPAGSTCPIGRAKYTLDRAARLLKWETCESADNIAPAHLATGSTTITLAELAKINAAMNGVELATGDICGADKPLLQIKVTTPAGEKTYTDSFYSCDAASGRTYVDNIDAVFGALRTAAQ